ncbi:hypothetical protein EVAR_67599_1 [Eumeta japonica]|uniref:Uncharacterized protein n=1 Tax=Eumeta variegata TaxID=151549 RepID=A0A4C2A8W7_EUMVA|nr:hypothetical protein EVAR_67599_1 [Eumeta japonica]
MVDHNLTQLKELQKKSGNNQCADCGSKRITLQPFARLPEFRVFRCSAQKTKRLRVDETRSHWMGLLHNYYDQNITCCYLRVAQRPRAAVCVRPGRRGGAARGRAVVNTDVLWTVSCQTSCFPGRGIIR